ncbi:ketopantoate reductase family protein [Paenibacillus sp. R14(2021)]|uniref:ketopantoate reductase family protein n=1 Tax=Paenibacillus sp. R14(2021) TaxID=2859228 RepID=UPI001C615D85|nr:2-dehydropantoate 2-reductase [Paenibacillus sp. R14(2021)]
MTIIIVGAGALGLLYAARLAQAGEGVTLLTRTEEQAQLISEEGIHYENASGSHARIRVQANTLSRWISDPARPTADWLLLAVKQPHVNEVMLQMLSSLAGPGTPLLALQNGIGHLERLQAALPRSPVFAAVTTEGALRTAGNAVRHTGQGFLAFGNWTKNEENISKPQKMLLKSLLGAGIEAILSNDMENRVYVKLLLNAVINPLTAIFQVKNGDLPQDPFRLQWMRALHEESEVILRGAGFRPDNDTWESLLKVCEATAQNESSMLRDVRSGRVTEIAWINGGIAARAKQLGLPSPMNDAVTALIVALHAS